METNVQDQAEETVPSPEATQGGEPNGTAPSDIVTPAPKGANGSAASRPRPNSFADMLVEARMLSMEQAANAQGVARRDKVPFWQVLVRDGIVMSQDLAAVTALRLGLSMVDLRNQTIDPEAVAVLPENVARRYTLLAIRKDRDRLVVAMADPTDLHLLQDLTARTGNTISPVVATPEDILEHIDTSYRLMENVSGEGWAQIASAPSNGGRVSATSLRQVQPTQVVDLLLRQGVQDRASDIHIEPEEARLRVRFRIDGILHDVLNLPIEMHPAIISRIKIKAPWCSRSIFKESLVPSFADWSASGAFFLRFSAMSRTFACSWSFGTAKLTKRMSAACLPVMFSPVSAIHMRSRNGIISGMSNRRFPPGAMPQLISGRPSRASSSATAMSHAHSALNPAPKT